MTSNSHALAIDTCVTTNLCVGHTRTYAIYVGISVSYRFVNNCHHVSGTWNRYLCFFSIQVDTGRNGGHPHRTICVCVCEDPAIANMSTFALAMRVPLVVRGRNYSVWLPRRLVYIIITCGVLVNRSLGGRVPR